MKQHWYLVAHAAGARLFAQDGIKKELRLVRRFENPQGKLKSSELVSDRQGRADRLGFSGHAALGSQGTAHMHVLESFAHELGAFLEDGAKKNSFDTLVVVAEPHFLGELNKHIGPGAAKRQRPALQKDFAHISDHEILEHLNAVLCYHEDVVRA